MDKGIFFRLLNLDRTYIQDPNLDPVRDSLPSILRTTGIKQVKRMNFTCLTSFLMTKPFRVVFYFMREAMFESLGKVEIFQEMKA